MLINNKSLAIILLILIALNFFIPNDLSQKYWLLYLVCFPYFLIYINLQLNTLLDSRISQSNLFKVCVTYLLYIFIFSSGKNSLYFIKIGLIATCLQFIVLYALKHKSKNFFYEFFEITNLFFFLQTAFYWTIAASLLWWTSLDNFIILKSPLIPLGLILIPIVSISLYSTYIFFSYFSIFIDCILILILCWKGTAIDFVLSFSSIHHWDTIAGPAQSLREGGWLLWDIPSQYGFLSVITVALLPIKNIYVSIYYVNAFCICISICVAYSYIRSIFKSNFSSILSFLLCYSCIILLPGWQQSDEGSIYYPMVSGFRFLWVYLILGLYLTENLIVNKISTKFYFTIGSIFWILGILWSCESAFFVTCLWILPQLKIILDSFKYEQKSEYNLSLLYIPTILFLLTILSIILYYLYFLGHFPDPLAYIDHAISFYDGFGRYPVNNTGSIILVLTIYSVTIYNSYKNWKNPNSYVSFAYSLCLWSVCSYYISRSHDNNISNLFPLIFISLLGSVKGSPNIKENYKFANELLIPLSVTLIIISFHNFITPSDMVAEPIKNEYKFESQLLPKYTPNDEESFKILGLSDDTPLFIVGSPNGMDLPLYHYRLNETQDPSFNNPKWLPSPASILYVLSLERREVYIKRFIERHKLSGVILYDETILSTFTDWLQPIIEQTHDLIRVQRHGKWRIQEYKLKN